MGGGPVSTAAFTHLSRRERQIMDLLYQHGRLSAAEVHARLPDPPSYSAVRALLRVLEQKGHVRHQEEGMRYVFLPKVTREKAKRSALAHLVRTFFDGSPGQAAAAASTPACLESACSLNPTPNCVGMVRLVGSSISQPRGAGPVGRASTLATGFQAGLT